MKDDISKLELKAGRQEESFNELNEGIANKSSFLASMPSIWPRADGLRQDTDRGSLYRICRRCTRAWT